ncbi:MAG: tetratricopeptide repeat protein [Gammaproteobacteria bacterium]|nr:tetratricopeptide repeat protein [Gammaproteobacteria bacterium]
MDVYETEREQVEALRKWWQENGKALIIGVVLGLGGLFGYRAWQDHVTATAESAADLHAGLVAAVEQGQHATVIAESARLRNEFGDTPYAALGTLAEARVLVADGDPEAARASLQWVIEHADQPDVVDVARLRLARLLFALGEYDAARARLAEVPAERFAAEVAELRGDLLREADQPEAAREAYLEALGAESENRAIVQMKLDELGLEPAPESTL